jgi:predicted esterase
MVPDNQLPAILCLHGAGTNATIFRLQARMLVRKLSTSFRFIFVEAPFESLPGPGIVPTYEGMTPYLWWHCDGNAAERFDISIEEVRRRKQVVRKMLADHLSDESVVGIMAFSQGARVATGVCLDSVLGARLKFAILIAATFPALGIDEHDDGEVSTPALEFGKVDQVSGKEPSGISASTRSLISIPSVHVQGTSDPWKAESARLRDAYFVEGDADLVTFSGAHTVPVKPVDVAKVVSAVLKAWEKSRTAAAS